MPKAQVFHLSVNKDGVVSLWDTAHAAKTAHVDDVYVALELTAEQQNLIFVAKKMAQRRVS